MSRWAELLVLSSLVFAALGQSARVKIKIPNLPLPSYIGQGCKYNDPNLNECVVRKGAPAVRKIANGDPKYRIPRLDPLVIETLRVDQGTRQVGLSLECRNCSMYGLKDIDFVKARVDLNKSHCEWDFTLDRLGIRGKYNVSGQVLILPILGNGDANITARDNMNTFLNENWQEIMKDLSPAFSDALGEVFKQTLTSMADLIPFQTLFPKD